MSNFKKTIAIALGIGLAIVGIGLLAMDRQQFWLLALGIYVLIYAGICLIFGLLLLLFFNNKEVGQALLLSSGILILIGFSVCTGLGMG
jgi:hypothetical protein